MLDKRQREHVAFDLDREVAASEQEFHHQRVANIIGELLVRATHTEGPGKFSRLEIDVIITERLGNF